MFRTSSGGPSVEELATAREALLTSQAAKAEEVKQLRRDHRQELDGMARLISPAERVIQSIVVKWHP
jgi:hypothetical protein